jgi:hypothetical protein
MSISFAYKRADEVLRHDPGIPHTRRPWLFQF